MTGQVSKGGIQTLPMLFDAVPVVGIELGFMSHDTDVITLFFNDPDVKFRNNIFERHIVENHLKRDTFQPRNIGVGERGDGEACFSGEILKLCTPVGKETDTFVKEETLDLR